MGRNVEYFRRNSNFVEYFRRMKRRDLDSFFRSYSIAPAVNTYFRSGESNIYPIGLRYCDTSNNSCCPGGDFQYTLDQLVSNYGYRVGTWGAATDPTKKLSISFLLGEPGTQQDVQNQLLKDGDQVAILVSYNDGTQMYSKFLSVNDKILLSPVFMLSPSSWSGSSWFKIKFLVDSQSGDIGFKLSWADTGRILGVQGTGCQQMMYAHGSNTKDAFFYTSGTAPIPIPYPVPIPIGPLPIPTPSPGPAPIPIPAPPGPAPTPSPGPKRNTTWIIIGVVSSVALILLIAVIFFIVRRRS